MFHFYVPRHPWGAGCIHFYMCRHPWGGGVHFCLSRRPCAPWSARAAHRPDTSPATDGSNSEIGLMLKTCSRPGAEKSGESVEEISTPGNLSRISRNPGKSETYRITDRPLKKAEAMGQGGYGRARRSPSKLSAERRPGHFYAHQLYCYCPRAALHCGTHSQILGHLLDWTKLLFCSSRGGKLQ